MEKFGFKEWFVRKYGRFTEKLGFWGWFVRKYGCFTEKLRGWGWFVRKQARFTERVGCPGCLFRESWDGENFDNAIIPKFQ